MLRLSNRILGKIKPGNVVRSITASHTTVKEGQLDGEIKNLEEFEEEKELDPFTQEFLKNQIKINEFQRVLLSAGSSLATLLDPRRQDMLACFGETTGEGALKKLLQIMESSEEGQQILAERPRINTRTVDFEKLKNSPHNTLGYVYWKFLEDNKVGPDGRWPVKFIEDPLLGYVMTRYRESHDLVHATLGMPTTMLGEVAIKWIEAFNTGLPMCLGGGIFGAFRLKPKHRQLYRQYYLPWAIENGRAMKPAITIYWEKRWDQDIEDLRKELNVKTLELPKK